MIPKTLSATAAQAYEDCPARFAAEYDGDRARSVTGEAAGVGIVCHAVLERWVDHYKHYTGNLAIDTMKDLYEDCYWETFGDRKRYNEGLKLVQSWRARQDWTNRTVLTIEKRDSFPLMTSAGEIPFIFVMDRLDQIGLNEIEVVDYKTTIASITPEQLHDRIQARSYAVAAQIMYPEAERIWVTFDLLRHDTTVGTVFTREENRDNWKYLQNLAQRIVDDDDPQETLNPDCRWCVRKHVCTQLQRHAAAGGALAITDPVVAAKKRFELECVSKALAGQIDDLDELLLDHLKRLEVLEFDAGGVKVEVTASRRRNVDPGRAAPVLGPAIMLQHAGLTMKAVDALLKGNEITPEQKAELKKLIRSTVGEPGIKVVKK